MTREARTYTIILANGTEHAVVVNPDGKYKWVASNTYTYFDPMAVVLEYCHHESLTEMVEIVPPGGQSKTKRLIALEAEFERVRAELSDALVKANGLQQEVDALRAERDSYRTRLVDAGSLDH